MAEQEKKTHHTSLWLRWKSLGGTLTSCKWSMRALCTEHTIEGSLYSIEGRAWTRTPLRKVVPEPKRRCLMIQKEKKGEGKEEEGEGEGENDEEDGGGGSGPGGKSTDMSQSLLGEMLSQ